MRRASYLASLAAVTFGSLAFGQATTLRHLAPGSPGTLEWAIASYHPTHTRAVDEGSLPPQRASGACAADMALVDRRFCVDRYEGSLVEVMADKSLLPHSPYEAPEDGHAYLARSVAGVVPQGYVSAAQAQTACGAVHKRLCNATEWRSACGGTEGYVYPYGPAHEAARCNDRGKPPMLTLHPPGGKGWPGWGMAELNDPQLNQLPGTLAKTGEYAGCVNDLGVHDMVGNLHEWTADPNGTFQGGYYLDTTVNGEGCAYRTTAHQYAYHDYSTGFRCCADVGP